MNDVQKYRLELARKIRVSKKLFAQLPPEDRTRVLAPGETTVYNVIRDMIANDEAELATLPTARPLFEKRHYQLIADAINWEYKSTDDGAVDEAIERIVERLSNIFLYDNPHFAPKLFKDACFEIDDDQGFIPK